jgi:putative DNA primase/helicase
MALLNSPDSSSLPGLADADRSGVLPLWFLSALPHSESDECSLRRFLSEESLHLSLFASPDTGLPMGRFARLLFAHLWTQAVCEQTVEIDLARSWSHLCRRLKIQATGGPKGTLQQIRKQLRRLLALRLQVRLHMRSPGEAPDPEISRFLNLTVASHSSFPIAGERSEKGPLFVRLSDEFFLLVRQSPPFDLSFLHQIQSPLSMDLYCWCSWLSRHLPRIGPPAKVAWKDLQERLGTRIIGLRHFRFQVAQYLKTLLVLRPGFHAEASRDGLLVYPQRKERPARRGKKAAERSAAPTRREALPSALDALEQKDCTCDIHKKPSTILGLEEMAHDPFPVVDSETILRLEIPARRWLAEGLISERGIVMVRGRRGAGKSFFALGLACAIASGTPFLRYSVPCPAGVLLVDGDLPTADLQERLWRYRKAGFSLKAPLRVLCTDLTERCLPSLATPEGQAVIEKKLNASVKLLVLDSVNTLCSAHDGNDSASWSAFQIWLLKLRRQGYSVLVVNHDGRKGRRRAACPSLDVFDQVLRLYQPKVIEASQKKLCEVHVEVGRQVRGKLAEPFEVKLSDLIGRAVVWTPETYMHGTTPSTEELMGGLVVDILGTASR